MSENDWEALVQACNAIRGGEETQPGTIGSIEGRNIKPFPVPAPSSAAHSISGYIYKRQRGTEAAQYNIKRIKSTVERKKEPRREKVPTVREERPCKRRVWPGFQGWGRSAGWAERGKGGTCGNGAQQSDPVPKLKAAWMPPQEGL